MQDPATSFWSFSVKFYSDPSVGAACLDLQDRSGMDVNLVLYMLWWGQRGQRLSKDEIRHVIDHIRPWQESVVYPLRLVRRFLKNPPSGWVSEDVGAFRQRVKEDELQAERLQQSVMETAFPAMGQPDDIVAAADANLKSYAETLQTDFPASHLATLLARLAKGRE